MVGTSTLGCLVTQEVGHLQFQARLDHLVRASSGPHPKMAALLDIVGEHFRQHAVSCEAGDASRAIIFAGLRETVHSICEALRQHEPLIQAK